MHRALLVLLLAALACSPPVAHPAGSTASSASSGSASTGGSSGGESSTSGGAGSASSTGTSGAGTTTASGSTGSASSGSTGTTGAPDAGPADGGWAGLVADRPYYEHVPWGYDGGQPLPLVLMLHGYSSNHVQEGAYLGLEALAESRGFLYAAPDGTVDSFGQRFWNATDACCNFDGNPVDDVAYLTAVLDDMASRHRVDPKRVYVVGHSNGGFMAHRLACERAGRIAAAVSLAGAVWLDASRCQPSEPVSVLQVHGTADDTIAYDGGSAAAGLPAFPSAHQTVATWAQKDGCAPALTDAGPVLDLDWSLPGDETVVERYDACPVGDVELWTLRGGGHIPSFNTDWPGHVVDYLYAHPKP